MLQSPSQFNQKLHLREGPWVKIGKFSFSEEEIKLSSQN